MSVICPYCSMDAQLVSGATIYPHRHDLYTKRFYFCAKDQAWVGCHPGTDKPLGRLADAALRRAKSAAHAAFDPLWKGGKMTRHAAYAWLGAQMGLPPHQTHIGMFNIEQCASVVELCQPSAPKPKDRSTREFQPAVTLRTDFSLVERAPEIAPWN